MKKTKENTVSYQMEECNHERLRKIAPMWFYCVDCGRVFYFMLSMQFSYNEAIEHWSDIVGSLNKVKQAVRKSEKKREKFESKAEKEAIEKYKKDVNKKKNVSKKAK